MRDVDKVVRNRHARWVALVGLVVVGLVVIGCGSSTPSITPSTSAPASAVPSAAPASPTAAPSKGPATATISLVGDPSLTGPLQAHQIECGLPSLNGPQITVLGQAGTTGPDIVLFINAGQIEVRAATGAAATLVLRSFVGTGVTNFDAATSATIDTPLTETTEAATATGDIGAVRSISGSIDCGNEQSGSANVLLTGLATQGTMGGALTSIHVTCTVTASGTYVGVEGLTTAGTVPVLVFVTASTGMLQVAVESKSAGAGFYSGKTAGITTLSANGAHVDGDVTEGAAAGATPHTLHVTGDATCGTVVQQ